MADSRIIPGLVAEPTEETRAFAVGVMGLHYERAPEVIAHHDAGVFRAGMEYAAEHEDKIDKSA